MHNLFRMSLAGQPRGLLLQAPDGPRAAADLRQGPDRHHRLPVRRGADPAPARAVRRGARGGRRVPRHLRRGELLLRADGPRPRASSAASSDDLLRLAKELGLPLVATNDLHYTKAEDATAHAALLCVQSGSTLADPNRFKFDADEFYLKTAGGDARGLDATPRGVRQHAADRRAVRGHVHRGRGPLHAALPRAPEGENEESWFVKEVETGPARALPGRRPRRRARAGRVRDRGHRLEGVRRLLPGRRRLHQLGQGATASGSVPAVAPAPARCARTRCGSPTSTRCSTA